MRTVAIIQARMKSSRLQGKVLTDIGAGPLLRQVVERASKARIVDKVVIATSFSTEDLDIVRWGQANGYSILRGGRDENDVLYRFYDAAILTGADIIVRLTGDNPFVDPEVIDALIERQQQTGADYVGNTNPPTLPDGLDTEVFTFDALQRTHQEATLGSDREHVTPYMRNSGKFSTENVLFEPDLSRFRLTVDEPEDLELVRSIFAELGPDCGYKDAVALLQKREDLTALNSQHERDEGYKKSIKEDKKK